MLAAAGDLTVSRAAASGLPISTQLGAVTTTQGYNAFGEPIAMSAAYRGLPLWSVGVTRDKLGRILQKVETLGGTTSTWDYTYDLAGRLVDVAKDGTPFASYTYDAIGNRLSYDGPFGSSAGAYDAQDRLLSYGAASYTYTANGDLTSKTVGTQTATYQYDVLGNLLRADLPGGITVEYLVRGLNRRIGKKVNGVLTQGFLYRDALKPAAELDATGNLVSRFVYGARSVVPDYLVKGGVTYRILSDQLGSPRLVINVATGAIAQRLDYDEYGRILLDTNPGFQPFGFAGGLYDHQTGLVRFGARDYDPEVGQWTAKHPIGFGGGATGLFEYVGGDPVNRVDETGWIDFKFVVDEVEVPSITFMDRPGNTFVNGPAIFWSCEQEGPYWSLSIAITATYTVKYSTPAKYVHEMTHTAISQRNFRDWASQAETYENRCYKSHDACNRGGLDARRLLHDAGEKRDWYAGHENVDGWFQSHWERLTGKW